MAYVKKTWVDRVVEYPSRYTDELSNVKTFTPNPGTITAEGDPVNAVNLNRMEQGIFDGGGKNARFVVGVSTAGWTAANCDYLCDGTADQVEINAAITALPANGGEIVILDGTYNITAKINVNKSNVSIRGNGNATILKRMYTSAVEEGVITLTSVSYCRISDLQIDGNRATYNSTNNSGIYLSSSSNNTVTCITRNSHNSGINLSSSSNNNTIIGNECTGNNYGINLSSSSNNNVTGNNCNSNSNYGIDLSSSSNNTITGNNCNSNPSYGIGLYLSSYNTVTGNNCNSGYYGIILYSSSNNNVTGNTCVRGTGLPGNYSATQYTIKLDGTSNNYNLISSNQCMGKAVMIEGGISNTEVNNKFA